MYKQGVPTPESDFNAPINDLKADNDRLKAELSELGDRAVKETELRHFSEEEVNRLKAIAQVMEADKQGLLQRVQELTIAIEYLKGTMAKSVDDCFNRLKLELNTTIGGSFYQSIQAL